MGHIYSAYICCGLVLVVVVVYFVCFVFVAVVPHSIRHQKVGTTRKHR